MPHRLLGSSPRPPRATRSTCSVWTTRRCWRASRSTGPAPSVQRWPSSVRSRRGRIVTGSATPSSGPAPVVRWIWSRTSRRSPGSSAPRGSCAWPVRVRSRCGSSRSPTSRSPWGMSEQGARDYVGQVVELRDRLPRLWAQVMSGRLPVWKARRVAEQTIPLNAAAAGFVDAQLAEFAHRLSLTRISRCVEAAIIRCQPDLAERRAEAAAEGRGVWVEDDTTDGTTRIEAVVDSPDAHAFDRALDDTATVLGRTRRRIAAGRCGGLVRSGCSPTRSTRSTWPPPPPPRPWTVRRRSSAPPRRRCSTCTCTPAAAAAPRPSPDSSAIDVRAGDPGPGRGPALLATRPGAHRRGRALADRAHPRHPDRDHPGGRPGRADRGRCLRTPRRTGPPGLRTRPHLRLPLVRTSRCDLRPGPHRPLRVTRRRRTARPDVDREHREAVPLPPPREDPRRLGLPTHRPHRKSPGPAPKAGPTPSTTPAPTPPTDPARRGLPFETVAGVSPFETVAALPPQDKPFETVAALPPQDERRARGAWREPARANHRVGSGPWWSRVGSAP